MARDRSSNDPARDWDGTGAATRADVDQAQADARRRRSLENAAYALGERRGRGDAAGRGTAADQAALDALEAEYGGDLSEIYQQGVDDARQSRPGRGVTARRRAGSRSPRRPARPRAPKAARTAARQLAAPVQTQLASGMRTLGLMVLLIGLYLVLTNAGKFSTAIDGVNGALRWLVDPTASIPYGS